MAERSHLHPVASPGDPSWAEVRCKAEVRCRAALPKEPAQSSNRLALVSGEGGAHAATQTHLEVWGERGVPEHAGSAFKVLWKLTPCTAGGY